MEPETEQREKPIEDLKEEQDSVEQPNQEDYRDGRTPVKKSKKEPRYVSPANSDSEEVSSEKDIDEGDSDENEIDGEVNDSSNDSDSSDNNEDEWITCGSDESGCQTFDTSDNEDDAPDS